MNNPFSTIAFRGLCCLATFIAAQARADDSDWVAEAGGSWANAVTWDNGIAGGTDSTAYFGLSLYPVPANALFTLDGARTIGNMVFTAQSGPDNWALNAGAGGPLTLDSSFDLSQVTVGCSSQQVSINTGLAGASGLEKLGPGTLVLGNVNTYGGPTLISAGTLLVNGEITQGTVTDARGVLGGSGTILGPVVVNSGATFAPGTAQGALTIRNSLVLQSGSTTIIAALGQAAVQGLSSVTYGGALVINNPGGASLGQSYSIFGAGSANGKFTSITPNPGPWLRWRLDPSDGVLSVVSSASQPAIAGIQAAGNSFVLSATNGAPGVTACLLTAADLSLAPANWTPLATNAFDMNGQITFTAPLNPNSAQQFYLISAVAEP
jgi:autotransporter-associated beta strand protein